MSGLVLSLIIGGGLGALLGHFGQCSSGSCPLTANWKRGAMYGAVLGIVFHFASGRSGTTEPSKHVKQVDESDFDAQVLKANQPVVVDFFASWCGPCKILAPRLDTLAGQFNGRIKFVSVDVDKAQSLAAKFNVRGVPTLLFFDAEGKVTDTSVGLISADVLRTKLEALLAGVGGKSKAIALEATADSKF